MCKRCDEGVSKRAIEEFRASGCRDYDVLLESALYYTTPDFFEAEFMWADGTCYGVEGDEEYTWCEGFFLPKYCPACGRKLRED